MTISGNVPLNRVESFLGHPRFPEARRAYIDGYLAVYSGEPALNKLLVEGARHVIITFALCLAAAQREDDPSTWLTLGKLQDVVSAHQVGSPGLVEAIVGRMVDRGLLEQRPAPGDGRKRLLVPTAVLMAHDADLIAAQAAACAILEPKPALALAMARDPQMQIAQRVVSIGAFAEAMQMLAAHQEIMHFVSRDSGYMVLLEVLKSALESPDGRIARMSQQGIADRYGVSRSHVRDLLSDAEAAGLVSLAGGTGGVEVQPALWQHYDRFAAAAMELFDRLAVEAADRLAQ